MPLLKSRPKPGKTNRPPAKIPQPALEIDPADLEFHREGTAWLWGEGTATRFGPPGPAVGQRVAGPLFSEAIDADSGAYWLSARDLRDGEEAFRLTVPCDRVEPVRSLADPFWIPEGQIAEGPDPAAALGRVEPTDDHGLVLRLAIADPADASRLLSPLAGECFRFGVKWSADCAGQCGTDRAN